MKDLKSILTMSITLGSIMITTGYILFLVILGFLANVFIPQMAIVGFLAVFCGAWLIHVMSRNHAWDRTALKSGPVSDWFRPGDKSCPVPKYRFQKSPRDFSFVLHTNRNDARAQHRKSWKTMTVDEARKLAQVEAELVNAYMIVQTGLHACSICRKGANGTWNWFR